jgi:hypothetical protein
MVLARYYRRFIRGFSKIAHSITSLQNKGVNIEWTLKCEKNFQWLNTLFTSTPILKMYGWLKGGNWWKFYLELACGLL